MHNTDGVESLLILDQSFNVLENASREFYGEGDGWDGDGEYNV